MEKDQKSNKPSVIDFAEFRRKREIKEDLARGRDPLYVSHLRGKVTGSPHFRRPEAEDFGDRLSRIKSSLEKINRLMTELKRSSNPEQKSNVSKIR